MRREKSCGAVLFRRDGDKVFYLLLKYFGDYFDFPKGKQESGESEIETVKREVEEETNINEIKILNGFHNLIKYFYQRDNKIIHKEVAYYVAETGTADVSISYEHKGYKWVEYDAAMSILKFQNSKDLLARAKTFIEDYISGNKNI